MPCAFLTCASAGEYLGKAATRRPIFTRGILVDDSGGATALAQSGRMPSALAQQFSGAEREVLGSCHFAGEHTSQDSQGDLEGAVESGIRAAAEVVVAL